jgi:lysozyme family protein
MNNFKSFPNKINTLGVNRAIKTLQQVVGVSSDGRVDPLTLQAIIAATAKNKEYELCDRYNAVRESCYRRWGVGSQAVFLAGWMNRLNALRRELKSSA